MAREFDRFFRENYDMTVRGLILDGTRADDAHDAAQEAYVRAYARWWRVGHYREPAAWVRRVAVNVTRDQHRRVVAHDKAMPKLATAQVVDGPGVGTDLDGPLDEALEQLRLHGDDAFHLIITHWGHGQGHGTKSTALTLLDALHANDLRCPTLIFGDIVSPEHAAENKRAALRHGAFAYCAQWETLFQNMERLLLPGRAVRPQRQQAVVRRARLRSRRKRKMLSRGLSPTWSLKPRNSWPLTRRSCNGK